MKSLFDVMRKRGEPITGTPYIEGKEVDLYQLYQAVMLCGGSQKVHFLSSSANRSSLANSLILDQRHELLVTNREITRLGCPLDAFRNRFPRYSTREYLSNFTTTIRRRLGKVTFEAATKPDGTGCGWRGCWINCWSWELVISATDGAWIQC